MEKAGYDKLKKTITRHMELYYNQDAPEISDYEYDQLMLQLKEAEKEHPEWVTPDSPTQRVGGRALSQDGGKVTHHVPMLSIEDVFTKEEVCSWIDKVKATHPDAAFSVEEKIDGLSMALRYHPSGAETGEMELSLAETRGTGFEGDVITENALAIPDVKASLPLPYQYLELRGEVYMSHQDFEAYNKKQEEEGKPLAANPRNLAAGTLRLLNPGLIKERGLHYFVFNVQDGPAELMEGQVKSLDFLHSLGIPVTSHKRCTTKEEVLAEIDRIGERRGGLSYDIDGAVVKIDQISYRKDFPAGSKYSDGHIAYKYPPEERNVVMDDIEVAVGRTGKLTFTGIFHDEETGKAARLCGTSVSRATLHNQDYIRSMRIGIGGVYKLYKSGEIIPKLNGCVKEPEEVFQAPDRCPVCHQKLVREEDTADIRCVNPSCPAQLSRTISYFASRPCMDIAGLGSTLVDALVKEGYLHNCADIYHLKDHREELVEKGILGREKNTDKVLAAIEASKSNSPDRLLAGLGIRNVGTATAKGIMQHYPDIASLAKAGREELTNIPDVGETTADMLVSFFSQEENQEILKELSDAGVNMEMGQQEASSSIFEGKTFVMTGTLPGMSRSEAKSLIEKNGGKVTGSVSGKTDYLLAGENPGSKMDKARQLDIPVLSEEQLLQMVRKEEQHAN